MPGSVERKVPAYASQFPYFSQVVVHARIRFERKESRPHPLVLT